MSIETTISETSVYPSRWRLALTALGALGFVLLCLWIMWLLGFIEPHLLLVMLGGALFFGGALIYITYRLVFSQASLVFDAVGFCDNASLLGVGQVQWHEVKRVTVRVLTSQRFICVDPVDPEPILLRQGQLRAKFMRMNIGFLGTPITIPLNVFSESEKDLLELFRQYSGGRFPVE